MATAEYLPTPTTRFFCHSQCFIESFRRLGQGTLSTTSTLDFSVSLKPKSSKFQVKLLKKSCLGSSFIRVQRVIRKTKSVPLEDFECNSPRNFRGPGDGAQWMTQNKKTSIAGQSCWTLLGSFHKWWLPKTVGYWFYSGKNGCSRVLPPILVHLHMPLVKQAVNSRPASWPQTLQDLDHLLQTDPGVHSVKWRGDFIDMIYEYHDNEDGWSCLAIYIWYIYIFIIYYILRISG